jgi:Zn-dependent peptidase ImmA (M78 family)
MIAAEIARLRQACGVPLEPKVRGPVLLNRFFEEQNLKAIALPDLTCGRVREYLLSEGFRVDEIGDANEQLAGFMFFTGRVGLAFVNQNDILPRRRFTAAHELGHAVLHRSTMQFIADTEMLENDEAVSDIEREANRFAAELLMPEEICRLRAEELQQKHKACPRFVLAYRLASELLVSREAMRYRLKTLEIGDDD